LPSPERILLINKDFVLEANLIRRYHRNTTKSKPTNEASIKIEKAMCIGMFREEYFFIEPGLRSTPDRTEASNFAKPLARRRIPAIIEKEAERIESAACFLMIVATTAKARITNPWP
jgi:hypothetical protein